MVELGQYIAAFHVLQFPILPYLPCTRSGPSSQLANLLPGHLGSACKARIVLIRASSAHLTEPP